MTTSGHWKGLYNKASGLLLVHYYDRDDRVGRKYVLSNAHMRKKKKPPKAQMRKKKKPVTTTKSGLPGPTNLMKDCIIAHGYINMVVEVY